MNISRPKHHREIPVRTVNNIATATTIIMAFFAGLEMLWATEPDIFDVPRTLDLYIPTPEDNRLSVDRIELGQKLFFEKMLSRDRTLSCGSCHEPEHSFTVAEAFAKGFGGQRTTRNPPALVNRAYGRSFFWDGRAGSLEEQVLQPIQHEKELYLSLEDLESRLRQHEEYAAEFSRVFGREPRRDDIALALASFVRSLLVGDSPYDSYLLGDREALTESARRGLRLFRGKANCTACHAGPNLTDEEFHNTGVAWRDGKLLDEGRYAVTKDDGDRGAFKTPTLRQVSQTAPYMHDGSLPTLAEVVQRYNAGGVPNPHLDREIRPLNLTDEERKDLVAFLESLTGNIRFRKLGDDAHREAILVR
jgi:cytochrome c peroxidase